MSTCLSSLLASPEPSVRWLARTCLLGEDPSSPALVALQREIRTSPRARTLLATIDTTIPKPWSVYAKWQGAHWVLGLLSEIGYPKGDAELHPLRDAVLNWLNSKHHQSSIHQIKGLWRRCASQESYALYSQLVLGIADERTAALAPRLIGWQWPDGGWNCDKHIKASHSSFHESLLPMRALWRFHQETGEKTARDAALRTAELFLSHQLFKRSHDGNPIDPSWFNMHFPRYWHYDMLGALSALGELGLVTDPRCKPALDWLESRMLPDGGFPADTKSYRVSQSAASGKSTVDWGGVRKNTSNPWISLQALTVLRLAERWKP